MAAVAPVRGKQPWLGKREMNCAVKQKTTRSWARSCKARSHQSSHRRNDGSVIRKLSARLQGNWCRLRGEQQKLNQRLEQERIPAGTSRTKLCCDPACTSDIASLDCLAVCA